MWDWVVQRLSDEKQVIKEAPFSFSLATLFLSALIGLLIWQVFSWRYGGVIETLQSIIQSKDERIAKLQGETSRDLQPEQKIVRENVGGSPVEILPRAGEVVGGTVFNATSRQGYLVFFDAVASGVILGQTPPVYWVPAAPGDSRPIRTSSEEIPFDKAITIACVTEPSGTIASQCHIALIVR